MFRRLLIALVLALATLAAAGPGHAVAAPGSAATPSTVHHQVVVVHRTVVHHVYRYEPAPAPYYYDPYYGYYAPAPPIAALPAAAACVALSLIGGC
jgi:hypothetical protein